MSEKKKNILILTAKTGGGHATVANSLDAMMKKAGHNTIIYDMLESSSETIDTIIDSTHIFTVDRLPMLYEQYYKIANNWSLLKTTIKTIFNALCKKDIIKVCDENDIDVIFCTHPLHALVAPSAAGETVKKPKVISVITDYRHHAIYLSQEIDNYVVASEYSKNELISDGILKERIFAYGIPISNNFMLSYSKPKKIKDKINILITGGSTGVLGIEKTIESLQNFNSVNLTVVCGHNEKMYYKLNQKFGHRPNIKIIGFTQEMDKLMDKADFMIAKPGGLTVTESIIKRLPMVIPYFIPGQEKDNLDYLLKYNLSIFVEDQKKITDVVNDLISHPEKIEQISINMDKVAKKYHPEKIIDLI